MRYISALLLVLAASPAAFAAGTPSGAWVEGEIGLRLNAIPEGSAVHAAGLHIGDILQVDQSSVHRFNEQTGSYTRDTVELAMDTARRGPGITGETGFLVTSVPPDSLAAKAELQPGDFIARIDEQPVHSLADLARVRHACEARVPVSIYLIRWIPEQRTFMHAVSRRNFHATPAQPD